MKTIKVLFVCLGNICRSPTAEGVCQKMIAERGLESRFDIDSAGTSGWHIGQGPDPRTVAAAAERGYDLSPLRGRQAVPEDFECYDYILAMDESNLSDLNSIAPVHHNAKVDLFLEYGSSDTYREVPDPYHGGDRGFELVLDLIEDACTGFLDKALSK